MVWELVKIEKPDIILSLLEPFNLRVLISTVGLGVKIVVSERNDPHSINKYWLMEQLEKIIYRLADKIIVQTETIRKFFDGALAERTHIIYNPVNLPKEMVGKALNTEKKKRIVSVARLMPQKNHDILIKAFTVFSKKHPDYTLTIYGNGPQGEELKQLADFLGVGDKVYIPGASKTMMLMFQLFAAAIQLTAPIFHSMVRMTYYFFIPVVTLAIPYICSTFKNMKPIFYVGVFSIAILYMCTIVYRKVDGYNSNSQGVIPYVFLNTEIF